MSAQEKIARLESLLARVRERAEQPRQGGSGAAFATPAQPPVVARAPSVVPEPPRVATLPPPEAFEAAAPALVSPEPPRVASVPPPEPPRVPSAPPEAALEVVSAPITTPPPSAEAEASPWSEAPATEAGLEPDMEVEVSAEVVEVEIDEDEADEVAAVATTSGFPRESGAQPIAAAEAAGGLELEELPAEPQLEELPADAQLEVAEAYVELGAEAEAGHASESIPPEAPAANEVVEPAPSSSPRAIEPPTPRHTPPPESGKQVAVPSVKPEARLPSSTPPPSEGHTLMGGWREPGAALRPEARPGGVRVPPPPPPPPPDMIAPAPPPLAIPGSATPSVAPAPVAAARGPEAFVPAMPDFAEVGRIVSTPPVFAPASFGELLDASLSI